MSLQTGRRIWNALIRPVIPRMASAGRSVSMPSLAALQGRCGPAAAHLLRPLAAYAAGGSSSPSMGASVPALSRMAKKSARLARIARSQK